MSEIKKVLMTLLENGIIEEAHYINNREHVNTLEDTVDELLIEYTELANEANKEQDKALHLRGVVGSYSNDTKQCLAAEEAANRGSCRER